MEDSWAEAPLKKSRQLFQAQRSGAVPWTQSATAEPPLWTRDPSATEQGDGGFLCPPAHRAEGARSDWAHGAVCPGRAAIGVPECRLLPRCAAVTAVGQAGRPWRPRARQGGVSGGGVCQSELCNTEHHPEDVESALGRPPAGVSGLDLIHCTCASEQADGPFPENARGTIPHDAADEKETGRRRRHWWLRGWCGRWACPTAAGGRLTICSVWPLCTQLSCRWNATRVWLSMS